MLISHLHKIIEVVPGRFEMGDDQAEVLNALKLASQGDGQVLGGLLEGYRDRLRRMVRIRLDPRVQGRIDASDVVQETFLEALRRADEYLRNPAIPYFLWVRFLAGQKMMELHRRHLGAQMRDARREVALAGSSLPPVSSAAIARHLVDRLESPEKALERDELKARLEEALNRMDPLDREILSLRHFEQLTNSETARALGIQESAASNRYVRALKRFRTMLESAPGEFGDIFNDGQREP